MATAENADKVVTLHCADEVLGSLNEQSSYLINVDARTFEVLSEEALPLFAKYSPQLLFNDGVELAIEVHLPPEGVFPGGSYYPGKCAWSSELAELRWSDWYRGYRVCVARTGASFSESAPILVERRDGRVFLLDEDEMFDLLTGKDVVTITDAAIVRFRQEPLSAIQRIALTWETGVYLSVEGVLERVVPRWNPAVVCELIERVALARVMTAENPFLCSLRERDRAGQLRCDDEFYAPFGLHVHADMLYQFHRGWIRLCVLKSEIDTRLLTQLAPSSISVLSPDAYVKHGDGGGALVFQHWPGGVRKVEQESPVEPIIDSAIHRAMAIIVEQRKMPPHS